MYIDAHCHLDFYKGEEIEKVVEHARAKNVEVIICNGVNPVSNRRVLDIVQRFPEVKAALGLYPVNALELEEKRVDDELKFIERNREKIVAIGEVGLDLKESDGLERQKNIFQRVIELAKELDKPLIVHSRKAEADTINILEKEGAKKVVMHCFSGKMKLVERIVELGWFLTIPTNVRNSEHFQEVIRRVPIENLLCETDSPFLHPDKKERNEPANVVVSYEKIAEIKGLRLSEVEGKIEENFRRLFG